jgi:hypothetical protein
MCDPVSIAAIAATVAGSGLQAYASNQQLNKQNNDAAAGIIKQGQLQKQGENDVSSMVNNTLATSNATTQAKTEQQLNSYRAALQQAQPISKSASPAVPGSSGAYAAEQAKSGASAADYVNKIAGSAAVTQGTQLERVGEGQAMASTSGQLGILNQQSAEQSYLTKLQITNTQANPWLTGMSMLLKGAGMGMGMANGAGMFGSGGTFSQAGADSMGAEGANIAAGTSSAMPIGGSALSGPSAAFGAGQNVNPMG